MVAPKVIYNRNIQDIHHAKYFYCLLPSPFIENITTNSEKNPCFISRATDCLVNTSRKKKKKKGLTQIRRTLAMGGA